MATVTAAQLISAGLGRADMVDSTTAFIPHPATDDGLFNVWRLLNAAISELFEILFEADSEAYKSTNKSWSTVLNQSAYVLTTIIGSDFYHLRGLGYFNGSIWVPIDKRVNFADRYSFPQAGVPRGYSIEGDNLIIYPAPAAVYSMQADYVPLPDVLTTDAGTIDLKGPWREFVEIHFAIQALEKEESDTTALAVRLRGPQQDGNGGLTARIRNAAKKRDSGQPVTPVDVQGDGFFPSPYPGGRIFW